jgi:hypothetical protein
VAGRFTTTEAIERLNRQMEKIARIGEPLRRHNAQLASVFGDVEKVKNQLAKVYGPKIEEYQRFARTLANSNIIQEMHERWEQLPQKIKGLTTSLANEGWFVDMEMPLPFLWKLQALAEEGDFEKIEELLCAYFIERLDAIADDLVSKFPGREKIINAAISAHNAEQYELSVPVLLAQADGVCAEITSYHFFLKARGTQKPQVSKYLEDNDLEPFMMAMMNPMAEPLPIFASERQRGENFTQLNRHLVLHGESLDYGTEENSLRALSLLNFISSTLTHSLENAQKVFESEEDL